MVLQNKFASSFSSGFSDLDWYFGLFFCGLMFLQLAFILLGLKFRNRGYKIFLRILSLLMLVPVFFCFQDELQFYYIGIGIFAFVLTGLVVSFRFN